MPRLTADIAHELATVALTHVTREYPNKLDHVLTGPEDLLSPRALHPVFYGSFDWHSCVHGYWLLAHLYRRFPALPAAADIRALFDTHLIAERVAGECAYLQRQAARGFERPYGWAWLLKLAAELSRHDTPEGRRWKVALQPLAQLFVDRFGAFLPHATYPIRTGSHTNTAFAIRLALEYPDAGLRALLSAKAVAWYGEDRDAQAWEPGGDDFLSPTLIEAECMRLVLPASQFRTWLHRFLPRLSAGQPVSLFTPATVTDRSDGKLAHLDGLNLSRAWCWRALAGLIGDGAPGEEAPGDKAPRDKTMVESVAEAHIAASLPHVAGDYMGSHWLASFAALALGDEDAAGPV